MFSATNSAISLSCKAALAESSPPFSEHVADSHRRRELIEDAARSSERHRVNLRLRKGRNVIQKIDAGRCVALDSHLDPAAAHYQQLQIVAGGQCGDIGKGLIRIAGPPDD